MFFFDAKCNITYMQAILYMNEKMECTKKKKPNRSIVYCQYIVARIILIVIITFVTANKFH